MNSLVHGNVFLELHSQNGNAPEWIHVVPSGTFKGRDGRGPFHLNNMQKVIAASLLGKGTTIPIDYNHNLYTNGSDARAAGWIDRMESRADGIWAHANWTPAASKMIAEKEWRFLSPALATDEAGNITRIDGVGLVNRPNLELTALNSQQSPDGSAATSFRDDLCKILSLPKTADDDAVIAEVLKLVASAPGQKSRAPQKHSSLSGQDHSLLLGIRKDVDMIRDTLALHGQKTDPATTSPDTVLDNEIKKNLGIAAE